MKRTTIFIVSLLITLTAGAQTVNIHKNDGTIITYPSTDVKYIDFTSSTIEEGDETFQNYANFNTYVEEIYNRIPNKESCNYCVSFNWGDDEIMNFELGDSHVTSHFDLGDYANWYENSQSWLNGYKSSLWENAWYCIRQVNIGLAKLNKMSNCTQEEKDLIKGQLLFFRAWWHHQLMEWFGGLPYIDAPMAVNAQFGMSRLSFKACAEKCAADYSAAAVLLPNNWDDTTVGKNTKGKNGYRITKPIALGYEGKILLWAASPLWAGSSNVNGNAQTGALANGKTYNYDSELSMRAAAVLGQAIALIESGVTPYSLAEFSYKKLRNNQHYGLYNHLATDDSRTNFSDIFRTINNGWLMPGTVESMMRGHDADVNGSNWNFTKTWGPKLAGLVPHDAIIHMPTANYINYAYGMANGEPILLADGTLNPNSGFDPAHPFKDRDPRFYHDIVFDGFKYVLEIDALNSEQKQYQYMEMFTGGNMVPTGNPNCESMGSRTGYFCQKLVPHQCNEGDRWYDYSYSLQCYLPYMRVADIYTLYAEAGAAAQGANYKINCERTAEDAINVLRDRVGAGHVAERFVANRILFIDEVRRERACELAFEGFRWQDLQRWLLLTEYPYNVKTREEFTRVGTFNYSTKDPCDAEVSGFDPVIANGKETIILQRNLTTKHYLLPFKEGETFTNDEHPQNPDW